MDNPWVIDQFHITLRLVMAVALGGLIGIERETSNHAAGFRTHILVCLGSALIMLLSVYGFSAFTEEPNVNMDPARLAAQVVSGIGFLGAGAIIRNGLSISGLTTAASLWVVAAIGLAIGAGFYYAAVSASIFAIISLWILNKVEKRWFRTHRLHQIKIRTEDVPGKLSAVSAVLSANHAEIRNLIIEEEVEPQGGKHIVMMLTVKLSRGGKLIPIAEQLSLLPGVAGITLESV